MVRYSIVRLASLGLVLYGILGLVTALAVLATAASTFQQLNSMTGSLENQRARLAASVRVASRTLGDSAGSTANFQRSLQTAAQAADNGSQMSAGTAVTFRSLAQQLQIQIFGIQPLATLAPQFDQSASQMDQLAVTLGQTRDALQQNTSDVGRMGSDLGQLQQQLNDVATALDQAAGFGNSVQQFLPLQVAVYGMCALLVLQSLFSLIGGLALLRVLRAPGTHLRFVRRHNPEEAG